MTSTTASLTPPTPCSERDSTWLLQAEEERAAKERADERKGQIGTGDRSEKIRTYNFPQSRITDHRIGLTLHDLSGTLGGDLSPVVDALRRAEREAKLATLDG